MTQPITTATLIASAAAIEAEIMAHCAKVHIAPEAGETIAWALHWQELALARIAELEGRK